MTDDRQSLPVQLRRAVGFAALGSILAYAIADASAEFLILLGAGLATAWWIAVLPARPAPTRAINAGLLGVLTIGLLQLLRLGFTVNAFAYFIGLLLVVKLFDLRRARDWGQSLVLITGLYISAVLTSNSIFTGLMLLIGTALLFRAILRYHMFAAAERAASRHTTPDPSFRRDLRSLQIGAGFAIFLTATLAFLFLPRNLGAESFGNWGALPLGQTTGFTDEVQLGGPGLISQSQTPVMDITVLDRNERNRGRPDSLPIYLRGAVLERYEDGRWRRDTGPSSRSLIRAQFIPEGTSIRPWLSPRRDIWETEIRVTIRNAGAGTTPLFTLWQPLELRPTNTGQFLAHDASNGTVLREGSPGRVEYALRALDPRFVTINYPENPVRSSADAGPVPPRIAEYARQVLSQADIEPDPARRPVREDIRAVRAMENHLQSTFSYTLMDEPVPPGREPTEWFLFDRREGHCEYYASALALMCRAVGINARVITGYVASDFNEVTGQYLVRESNAHGWIEAEIAPGYWMTFDGTPPADLYQIHQPAPSLWRSVKKIYETIEFAWITGVVGFNTESQRRLLGDFATDFGLRSFGMRMIERLRSDGRGLFLRALITAAAVFFASMAVGLLFIQRRDLLTQLWNALISRLSAIPQWLRGQRQPWPDRLHTRTLQALERAGAPKPPGRPLRTHLLEARAALPDPLVAALTHACELLYTARFAPNAATPDEDFRLAMQQLRASEKRHRSAPTQPR